MPVRTLVQCSIVPTGWACLLAGFGQEHWLGGSPWSISPQALGETCCEKEHPSQIVTGGTMHEFTGFQSIEHLAFLV